MQKRIKSFLCIKVNPKLNSNKFLITRACRIETMVPIKCYTHFDSFLPSIYMFGTIFLSWTKSHCELLFLKHFYLKNGYPKNFINKCFKRFTYSIHIINGNTLKVEEKLLVVVFLHLDSISFQSFHL